MKVYLVYFFTNEYIDMYYPIHEIKYVLLDEEEAKTLIETENNRLKKRQDYDRSQLAWYTCASIGKPLFE